MKRPFGFASYPGPPLSKYPSTLNLLFWTRHHHRLPCDPALPGWIQSCTYFGPSCMPCRRLLDQAVVSSWIRLLPNIHSRKTSRLAGYGGGDGNSSKPRRTRAVAFPR
jgi:hypothetical protein